MPSFNCSLVHHPAQVVCSLEQISSHLPMMYQKKHIYLSLLKSDGCHAMLFIDTTLNVGFFFIASIDKSVGMGWGIRVIWTYFSLIKNTVILNISNWRLYSQSLYFCTSMFLAQWRLSISPESPVNNKSCFIIWNILELKRCANSGHISNFNKSPEKYWKVIGSKKS